MKKLRLCVTSICLPVQIGASFRDSVVTSGYPDIRWHQTADYGYVPNPRMKNVFMAVTMDITDFNSPYGG